MIAVSVGDLQRNLNTTILPHINAGETVQIIDMKSGKVKFNIVPPQDFKAKIDWPDYEAEAIECKGGSLDPVAEALNFVRQDRYFE